MRRFFKLGYRLPAGCLALLLLAHAACGAEAGAGDPAALWERFVARLRAGDFAGAHACFSAPSRRVFGFTEFSAHYHPLSAAYEAVLSQADDGNLRLDGEIARLRFVAVPPGGNRREGVLVTALMAREADGWYLVAAARERQAVVEAAALRALRQLRTNASVKQAWDAGRELGQAELERAAPEVLVSAGAADLRGNYVFALARDDSGTALLAKPLAPELRGFRLGDDGTPRENAGGEELRAMSGNRAAPAPNSVENLPPPPPEMPDPATETPKIKFAVREPESLPPPDLEGLDNNLPPIPGVSEEPPPLPPTDEKAAAAPAAEPTPEPNVLPLPLPPPPPDMPDPAAETAPAASFPGEDDPVLPDAGEHPSASLPEVVEPALPDLSAHTADETQAKTLVVPLQLDQNAAGKADAAADDPAARLTPLLQ